MGALLHLSQCVDALERARAGKGVQPVAVLLTSRDSDILRDIARMPSSCPQSSLLGVPVHMPQGLEVSVFLYADGRTAPIGRKAA